MIQSYVGEQRWGSRRWPVVLLSGHWDAGGRSGDEAAVRWWNVMACFKTAVMQVTGLASWLDDRTETMYRLTNGCVLAALDLMDR